MPDATVPRPSRLRALLPTFGNVAASIVLYYGLRKLGLNEVWSLTVPGVIVAVATTVTSLRRRALDTVGALVILELAVSLGLALGTHDARIVAIRPAVYMLLTGAFFLFTCLVGKPIIYVVATPMATNGGEPKRTEAYRVAWDDSAAFRRLERLMTGGVGLSMFIDSALRVGIVYSYPSNQLDRSFLISNVAAVVMIILCIATMVLCVRPLSRIVDEIERTIHDQPAAAIDFEHP